MKSIRLFLILTAAALMMTACSANVTDGMKPSPSVAPSPTAAAKPVQPTQEIAPSATSNLNAQTDTFIAAGEPAVITVGSTKLTGKAYHPQGDETELLLPFVEVCKALGWKVDEPAVPGKGEIKLSQDGMDEVVVSLEVPADQNSAMLKAVTAAKAGQPVSVSGEPLAWIDGQLYTTEKFISSVVQQIEVDFDGASAVTVKAKA